VQHRRAAQHLVARVFERLTRRAPEKGDLARWSALLHRDPYRYLELSREWLLSESYAQRLAQPVPKSNRLFVRSLFVDLLGRLPTQEELEPMRNALDGLADSRPLRSVLARLLLDSGQAHAPAKASVEDPSGWIAERFRRLLGREASAEELRTFLSVFHDAECRTETILYALLSHSEYHSY
jgi:HEAT repeat protein